MKKPTVKFNPVRLVDVIERPPQRREVLEQASFVVLGIAGWVGFMMVVLGLQWLLGY